MSLRTYGRLRNADGTYKWVQIVTDDDGYNDAVWLTTLIQCLKLNLGESPMYANYGIPAQPSVIQQIFPDFYVNQTQTQFSPYFANLMISKVQSSSPVYNVNVITHQGATIATQIAV